MSPHPLPLALASYRRRRQPSWWLHLGTAIGSAVVVGLVTYCLWWVLAAWLRWMGAV